MKTRIFIEGKSLRKLDLPCGALQEKGHSRGTLQTKGHSRGTLRAAALAFAARSSARIGVPFREVTVILQNDAESDAAHRAIMGVKGATDVITQRYDAMPPESEGIYGELYVNVDQALRAAPKRRGWSPEKELLLYIAHGMDHLSGADDHSPADYARMRRRELAWLRELPPASLRTGPLCTGRALTARSAPESIRTGRALTARSVTGSCSDAGRGVTARTDLLTL